MHCLNQDSSADGLQGVVAKSGGDQPAAVPGVWMRVERLSIPASIEALKLDQGRHPRGVEQGLRGVSNTGQRPQSSLLRRYGSNAGFLPKTFQQHGFGPRKRAP